MKVNVPLANLDWNFRVYSKKKQQKKRCPINIISVDLREHGLLKAVLKDGGFTESSAFDLKTLSSLVLRGKLHLLTSSMTRHK